VPLSGGAVAGFPLIIILRSGFVRLSRGSPDPGNARPKVQYTEGHGRRGEGGVARLDAEEEDLLPRRPNPLPQQTGEDFRQPRAAGEDEVRGGESVVEVSKLPLNTSYKERFLNKEKPVT
jgi:hypothetical protein